MHHYLLMHIYYVSFRNLTINNLAIPDTYCSMDKESGYQCPDGFECVKLEISKYKQGFQGINQITVHFLKYL
jgi:hypothetical protein